VISLFFHSKTKRCVICGRCGAYAFNDLCAHHWNMRIEENIKKVAAEIKKREGF
jgi:hypothetical protein